MDRTFGLSVKRGKMDESYAPKTRASHYYVTDTGDGLRVTDYDDPTNTVVCDADADSLRDTLRLMGLGD
jgi:hypothetical protein